MKYKGYFNFEVNVEGKKTISNLNLPVSMFQVEGGASRIINVRSTDDISLISELEQARTFKNIVLYLSSTGDHRDMKAAMDLVEIGDRGFVVRLIMTVERYSGGKMLEGIALFEPAGELAFYPRNASQNTLMVTLKLPTVEIFQGKVKNHFIPYISKSL